MTSPSEVLSHLREQKRREIVAMPAGLALDAMIAERVFRHHLAPDADPSDPRDRLYIVRDDGGSQSIPPYSSDPGAAWTVVQAMRQPGRFQAFYRAVGEIVNEGRSVHLSPEYGLFKLSAPEMAHAIGRAALLALLDEGPR